MIREDTNKNIIERFPSMESDLKLHAIPQLNKNKEDILGVIVEISYYNAKQFYNIKKEDTSILGRSDLSFIPYDNCHIPFIVELKINSTPEDAITQIKEKSYFNSLGSYHGKVLLLGISYDEKTLKHNSKVEIIEI